MTFDEMLDAFGDYDVVPVQAIEQALAEWDECGPRFRSLLHGYVHGEDVSERTERSLYVIVHLLAEKADTAAFADLCLLAEQVDRFDSVYGPAGATHSFARVIVSTFDGDPAPIERLVTRVEVDDFVRCDVLLTLAYLACTDRIAEGRIYAYLSQLAPRLPDGDGEAWYGYARSVAALGFAGLSGSVDAAFKAGHISEYSYTAADFWRDLRETQAAGRDVSGPAWADVQPIGSAVDQLCFLDQAMNQPAGSESFAEDRDYEPLQPIRNPLRDIGRNDPCPCGSGKKYKKCCLQAGVP